ncbi:MAG: hypothetical protein C0518_11385 [Opitutus sp.]|nr:hypothetical protein [Opitutus sp.]
MPASPETAIPTAASADEPVLLGAEAFFVRRVALDPATDAAGQVEIALEASAPFAVAQLFYGFLRAADGKSALVFATHRRRFAAESWDGASAVLPNLVALLGEPPSAGKIRVWRRNETVVAAAWDGAGELPAFVLGRAGEESARDELVAELVRRLGRDAAVEDFSGEVTTEPLKSGGLQFTLGNGGGGRSVTSRFTGEAIETMDVRDKAVLAERRSAQQRDKLLWRVLQTAVGGLLLAGLLELGMVAGGVLLRQQREAQAQVAPEVERIQTAQSLGTRIEEMSRRRLRPFEMLAVLNAVRPSGVLFTRSVTSGQGSIEIEGQTANADSVGAFESALRALPSIETLEVRDLRLRDGLTTFQLAATFREGSLASVAGTTASAAPAGQPGGAK